MTLKSSQLLHRAYETEHGLPSHAKSHREALLHCCKTAQLHLLLLIQQVSAQEDERVFPIHACVGFMLFSSLIAEQRQTWCVACTSNFHSAGLSLSGSEQAAKGPTQVQAAQSVCDCRREMNLQASDKAEGSRDW